MSTMLAVVGGGGGGAGTEMIHTGRFFFSPFIMFTTKAQTFALRLLEIFETNAFATVLDPNCNDSSHPIPSHPV